MIVKWMNDKRKAAGEDAGELEIERIDDIFDYFRAFGNCYTKFKHEDARIVTLKWHGGNIFTASWIENDNILTGVFSEEVVYEMLNERKLVIL